MKGKKESSKDEELLKQPLDTIFGRVPYFTEACDPSIIKWENRHVKDRQFNRNYYIGCLKMLGLIFVCFIVMIVVKQSSLQFVKKTANIDCKAIQQIYG